MKIAISAMGTTLDAEIDPRFGRCQYFIIVDPETMQFEVLENSSAMVGGGAGISTAQTIASKGIEVVLTGNCGPNAYQVLSAAGIKVITSVAGKVQDAIEGYQSGKFQTNASANVSDHFGMGATPSMRSGFGMGRGMGMSRGMGGRGMGKGMDMSMGFGMTTPTGPVPQPESLEQELDALRAQSGALAQQLNDIQRRIDELEKKRR